MTRAEAKVLANAYLSALQGVSCTVFEQDGREARTHWRFYWNTVAAIELREPALRGRTGRARQAHRQLAPRRPSELVT